MYMGTSSIRTTALRTGNVPSCADKTPCVDLMKPVKVHMVLVRTTKPRSVGCCKQDSA